MATRPRRVPIRREREGAPQGPIRLELGREEELFAQSLAGPSAGRSEHEELMVRLHRQVSFTAASGVAVAGSPATCYSPRSVTAGRCHGQGEKAERIPALWLYAAVIFVSLQARTLGREQLGRTMGSEDPVELVAASLRRCGEARVRTVAGSHRAWLLATLASRRGRSTPIVWICPSEEHAQEFAEQLAFFLGTEAHELLQLPRAVWLPAGDGSPYSEMAADASPLLQRLAVLQRIVGAHPPAIVVCAAASLRKKVIPRAAFDEACFELRRGEAFGREVLIERLVRLGFSRSPIVDDPATFSVRGALVDVFPPAARYPLRIEFFDQEIESIRLFDPETQRTLRPVERVPIHPVREALGASDPSRFPARQRLLALADGLAHPTRQTRALIEELESGRAFVGRESYVPAFFQRLDTLFDYFPEGTLWALDEPTVLETAFREQDGADGAAYSARVAANALVFPPEEFYCGWAAIEGELAAQERLSFSFLDAEPSGEPPRAERPIPFEVEDNADLVAELKRARAERGEMIFAGLAEELVRWSEERRPVVIAAGTRHHGDKLAAIFAGYQLPVARTELDGALSLLATGVGDGQVHLVEGALARGFRIVGGPVVLAHQEIFGAQTARKPPKRSFGVGLGDLRELKEGDHVVHSEHGVGRYRGLVQKQVDAAAGEYLLIEYHGGDRLYLPVHRLSQVAKYVGASDATPRLDRLGGVTWQAKQRHVQHELRKLGEELLQLYAQRQALRGHAYPEPDGAFREFEEAFVFEETEDQQRAIDDVIGDLVSERPMDRLVCGDVGFGKTEVALRAAFLVAMSGRQVAVLAPTTVLVDQHGRRFRERMEAFALRVETVSRFSKPKELRKCLDDLAAGKVDIVIGTHRLLSMDVRFRDLGLVVIDEEQRFGVAHKERLKRMRTQVDVLTLTATPIPRTLQMSMVGLREISVITTPPQDRLAIRTVMSRQSDAQLSAAIRQELARGGQIFFVHNEVKTIDEWAATLCALVPEARIEVGHGQMDARLLERTMLRFVRGESDILVCTTIIESGLDIPRANTMFVNRADRFGLSQLHQLRGRIGRSRQRAYCYLLIDGVEALSNEARLRLEALARFSQLGGGFSVATYDLELRGAGELLGGRQSGHIAAMGFEAYARILAEVVAELRGEPIVRESDPELNIRIPCFIPDDYVEDTGARLDLYKRLSDACRDGDRLAALIDEIADRYGALPPEVRALGELMELKGQAIGLGATLVDLSEGRLVVGLAERSPLDGAALTRWISATPGRYSLTPDLRLVCRFEPAERERPLEAAKNVLRALGAHVSKTA